MKGIALFLILVGVLIFQIDSHSLPMPKSLAKRISELKRESNGLPPVWSYHIHCLYVNGNEERVNSALKLREQFIAHFNLSKVEICRSTFDDVRLCMFGKFNKFLILKILRDLFCFEIKEVETIPDLDSPFVSGNWAVMVPVEYFSTSNSFFLSFI